MDVELIEAFSALKQSVTHHLMAEVDQLNVPATDHRVISQIISHFNGLAPLPNQCLNALIMQLVQQIKAFCHLRSVLGDSPNPGYTTPTKSSVNILKLKTLVQHPTKILYFLEKAPFTNICAL